MSSDHEQHVQQQFGATAEAYLTSAVHAQGAELLELRDVVEQERVAPTGVDDAIDGARHG